ncbi:hypothetical protein ACHAXR_007071 [Thalassiosira sp. AJA248-18]
MEPGIDSTIEELESLRKMRQSMTSPSDDPQVIDQSAAPTPDSLDGEKQQKQEPPKKRQPANNNSNPRPTLKSILHKPVGELTPPELKSLCNSIRVNKKNSSFNNGLRILERILLELDSWDSKTRKKRHSSDDDDSSTASNSMGRGEMFLKPIHVFSMLTALSRDIRNWKYKHNIRGNKNHRANKNSRKGGKINEYDIQRLVRVITLLNKHRHSNKLDPGCYTKDVPSFATMIAAEASRLEGSGVDAALLFLDMVEKEDEEGSGMADAEWDPRLIGAVLDALARVGRAKEAQALLERAMGVDISRVDSGTNNVLVPSTSTSSKKRLDPSQASLCYDALLRAWSKQAMLLGQAEPDNPMKKHQHHQNEKKKSHHQNEKKKSRLIKAASSLAQARHILLNHMPLLPELTITNRTCTAVLQGYSGIGLGSEGERLLMELEALHLSPLYSMSSLDSSPRSTLTFPSSLDVACYNSILHAHSQSQDSGSVVSAERLFVAMKERTTLNISVAKSTFSVTPPQPDFISYSSMLNCYSRHGMISKAEALLGEICDKFKPNVACYLPVIQALERSNEADATERVVSWIEHSERTLPKPNRLLYTAALRCMRRHGRGEEAEIILDKFRNAFPNRGGPDVYSYTLVLRAWEKTKPKGDRRNAAKRAKGLFDKMEKMSIESLLPQLDVNAYNILMNCYAQAGDADEAEKLLADLESYDQPNSKSYNLAIKALSTSGTSNAVDRAWQILYRLGYPRDVKSTLPLQEQLPFNVSIDNFNAMLKMFAKRGMASEAEALLNKIDELVVKGKIERGPDIQSYEGVLEALGRCGDEDAPSRAEALVTRLEVMSEMGGGDFQPSLLVYNLLINCYANAGMAGKAERLLERLDDPDLFSVGSTIKAIANSGKNQNVSISRAETLAKSLGGGNEIIFSHRLKLASKWGLGDLAEQLIEQMERQGLNPGIIHYTAAVNAWAKSTDDNATARAEILFKTMEDKFDLDRAAYHGLLLNYSAEGNSKKARRLLQRMLDAPEITPNRNSFTIVIDSYARSNSNSAGHKAEELLDQMRELHAAGNHEVEPDDVTYASVIRCKNKKIQDLTNFEKIELMRYLQIETWPFEMS